MGCYEQYDLSEDDPYLIPDSTCLVNNLNITNTGELNRAEGEITVLTMAAFTNNPVPLTLNLTHLQLIHHVLFALVYPFAGSIRTVEISKNNALFLPHRLIVEKSDEVFSHIKAEEPSFPGMTPAEFGRRMGYYLGQINMIHPFREGNGRTQRILIDQLADKNGFSIHWSGVSGTAMGDACRAARTGDDSAAELQRLLSLNCTHTIE